MRRFATIATLSVGLAALSPPAAGQERAMQGGIMGRSGMGMMGRLSAEDLNAYLDAHIAALRAGLKLSSDQERLWPPVEQAFRAMAQVHFAHMQTMAQRRDRMRDDPIGALRAMADQMGQGAEAARKLADAAAPLYASLDDGQKRRLRMLTPGLGAGRMMGFHRGGMMGRWFGGDDDQDERPRP
jgi:hypothetical protein